jgi:peptide/nickel transport system substrate-binding protein
MVDRYDVSPDRKAWTFTLRDGLLFHDGAPVTSDDVIASLKRWGQRDTMGQRLLSYVEGWDVVNANTFRLRLNKPYGLVLESLGKPGTPIPFIMPKRVADTPASQQIQDATGSGPFIFSKQDWKPGERVVYFRNRNYKPRPEPASGTAGGKVVKVDRVEWVILKDAQTQVNAINAGDVDLLIEPAFEQYRALKANPELQPLDKNPLGYGYQFWLRFNHLRPPFDNPGMRHAAMAALNQPAFLQSQVGISELYQTCFSIYPCGTPYATEKGMDFIANPNPKRAQELLRESGYNGTPIILLQQTDLTVVSRLPLVAAQLLRDAGFKVVLDAVDTATLQARRAKQDGWNIFLSRSTTVAQLNPIPVNALMATGYPKAFAGWPLDSELEQLLDAFGMAENEPDRKSIAEQVQVRAMEVGTHVPLGESRVFSFARKNVSGFVEGFYTVFWNLEKQ